MTRPVQLLLLGLSAGAAGCLATEGSVISDLEPDTPEDAGIERDGASIDGGGLRIDELKGWQYETYFGASVLGIVPNGVDSVEFSVNGVLLVPDANLPSSPVPTQLVWFIQETGTIVVEGSVLSAKVTDATGASVEVSVTCDSWEPELTCRAP